MYITGSDQVWNPNIVGELSDAYTLNFGSNNIKKISFVLKKSGPLTFIDNISSARKKRESSINVYLYIYFII